MSSKPLLGGLAPSEFLDQYWQKRPLLIRQALPGFRPPLEPDELAGLACEAEVESRIVLERDGPEPWSLAQGPFDEARFATLPETHWTLLVQECNRHVPALAELLERFDFIPRWRVDDVMVSFAPQEGSVGPHVDQYDVFLLQGLGRRRWQIDTRPLAEDNLIAGLDLRILREFEATDEWILEPGDMLYLPPGVAHHGVALEDAMTFSVGFRSPSLAEMITAYVDEAVTHLTEHDRYADPDLCLQAHPGEITPAARQRVRQALRGLLADDAALDQWFGRFVTEAKSGLLAEPPAVALEPLALRNAIQRAGGLRRSEDVRFAFLREASGLTLFVDGTAYAVDDAGAPAAMALCDHRRLDSDALALEAEAWLALLGELYASGYVELIDDEGETP